MTRAEQDPMTPTLDSGLRAPLRRQLPEQLLQAQPHVVSQAAGCRERSGGRGGAGGRRGAVKEQRSRSGTAKEQRSNS